MTHRKLLRLLANIIFAILILIGCTPNVTPQAGKWSGRAPITDGDGFFLVAFTVEENHKNINDVLVIFIPGSEEGKEYPYLPANGSEAKIERNTVSTSVLVTDLERSTTSAIENFWVTFNGKFVSSTTFEGTFESPRGNGEWTAEPND